MDNLSPCNRTCVLMDGACIGCGRTQAELASWSQMSTENRRIVMAQLPHRAGHQQSLSTPGA